MKICGIINGEEVEADVLDETFERKVLGSFSVEPDTGKGDVWPSRTDYNVFADVHEVKKVVVNEFLRRQ